MPRLRRLPDLRPPIKTRKKIERQTLALSVVLGCGVLGTAFFGVRGGGDGETDADDLLSRDDRRLQASMKAADCAVTRTEQIKVDAEEAQNEKLRNAFLMLCPRTGPCDHMEYKTEYGEELAVLKKDYHIGYTMLYIFLIIYMFIGLATVCDEFFVPALEAFVDEFGISMDVAGATFMAAGGSMPELLTSFISTFQGQPGIGFAAIVGSAVFNVLFVIAVCAIFNKTEALELSSWPLARDCSFYLVSLGTVAFVFEATSPNEIEWWEAALLLCEYVAYCTFMKFNGRIRDWVENKFASAKISNCQVSDAEANGDGNGNGNAHGRSNERKTTAKFNTPRMFRQSIIQLLTQNTPIYETAGIAAVLEIKGSLEETFKELDSDGSGFINANEIQILLGKIGLKNWDKSAIDTALRRITRTGKGEISFEDFKRWYIASETRISVEVGRVFDKFDTNKNQKIELDEITAMLKSLGHKLNEDAGQEVLNDVLKYARMTSKTKPDEPEGAKGSKDGSGSGATESWTKKLSHAFTGKASETKDIIDITDPVTPTDPPMIDEIQPVDDEEVMCLSFEQFQAWYTSSAFYKEHQQMNEQEQADEESYLTLDAPENITFKTGFMYALTYPLCAALYITIPDVRHPKFSRNVKVAICSFALSLAWIAIFCNLLFECTVVVSNSNWIPPQVSAVTVLAAGTSIPDLLSSYIVAKQGEGDMAVSSSIGSNIFDVTVGLPLPWLLYALVHGKPSVVSNDGLFWNLLVLIAMLASVIVTIKCMAWKMTKSLGYVMFLMYIVFLVQAICYELPKPDGLYSVDIR